MGINKVMLLGNLGKDPEVRYTPQQMAICRFSLATGERKKDQSGQWVDHTEWHNVVTFGRTAETCAKFLKKGRQVFAEGRLQTRKFEDKNGVTKYVTEVVAERVVFLGSGEGQGQGGGKHREERASGGQRQGWGEQQSDSGNGAVPAEPADTSDSIPF